jgi:hypothetical protein
MKFLHGQDMPTLAVLYEDNKQKRHVKTHVINLKDKELNKGPWSQPNVESGASLLLCLPRMRARSALQLLVSSLRNQSMQVCVEELSCSEIKA